MSEYSKKLTSFLIADLAGYTSLTETHGDLSAMDIVNRYVELVKNCLRMDTRLIERVGDEVLIVSDNVERLLNVSIDLVESTENEPNFPSIHVGLHKGKAIEYEGHYFGNTLNLTSRICSYSRGGQILCSRNVVKALSKNSDFKFLKIGDVQFKNVSKLTEVFEVVSNVRARELFVDPVCKMQIDIENPPAKIPYRNSDYYFCSFKCSKIFISNPENFI